ncbi:TPA: hypothetical protein EYG59_26600 [Candidatus Poribacteria bacterium]|nr:hypothetical protein [Candidatus Poribacteria bacterium]
MAEYIGVLRCLEICSFAFENYPTYCLYRRGGLVTGGGKGKPHWIVLPTKYQVGTDQSKLGY